jgi:winged helix DNA-binding protein
MLLERERTNVVRAVEKLCGLQAQLARPPHVGLFSRVAGYRREVFNRALHERKLVRATSMRATLHVLSARDFADHRITLQPMLSAAVGQVLRGWNRGRSAPSKHPDLESVVATARAFFARRPATFDDLRQELAKRHPRAEPRVLAYAVRMHLPLVQVPTDAPWGFPAAADFTLAESWLDGPLAEIADLPAFVMRYLAAFGPASVADMQNWSGLRRLDDAFAAARPKLVSFRDEKGRELFDLPRAPRPDPETPAPVRFLPEYDSLVLGHADRTRVISDEFRRVIFTKNLQILPTFLVDGRAAGSWKIERKKTSATLVATTFSRLSRRAREDLANEATELLAFAEPDATTRNVRFA